MRMGTEGYTSQIIVQYVAMYCAALYALVGKLMEEVL